MHDMIFRLKLGFQSTKSVPRAAHMPSHRLDTCPLFKIAKDMLLTRGNPVIRLGPIPDLFPVNYVTFLL